MSNQEFKLGRDFKRGICNADTSWGMALLNGMGITVDVAQAIDAEMLADDHHSIWYMEECGHTVFVRALQGGATIEAATEAGWNAEVAAVR